MSHKMWPTVSSDSHITFNSMANIGLFHKTKDSAISEDRMRRDGLSVEILSTAAQLFVQVCSTWVLPLTYNLFAIAKLLEPLLHRPTRCNFGTDAAVVGAPGTHMLVLCRWVMPELSTLQRRLRAARFDVQFLYFHWTAIPLCSCTAGPCTCQLTTPRGVTVPSCLSMTRSVSPAMRLQWRAHRRR